MMNAVAEIKHGERGLIIDFPYSSAQKRRFAFRPFNDKAGLVSLVEVLTSGPFPNASVAVYAKRNDGSWHTNYSNNGPFQREYGPETDEYKFMQVLVDQF